MTESEEKKRRMAPAIRLRLVRRVSSAAIESIALTDNGRPRRNAARRREKEAEHRQRKSKHAESSEESLIDNTNVYRENYSMRTKSLNDICQKRAKKNKQTIRRPKPTVPFEEVQFDEDVVT